MQTCKAVHVSILAFLGVFMPLPSSWGLTIPFADRRLS